MLLRFDLCHDLHLSNITFCILLHNCIALHLICQFKTSSHSSILLNLFLHLYLSLNMLLCHLQISLLLFTLPSNSIILLLKKICLCNLKNVFLIFLFLNSLLALSLLTINTILLSKSFSCDSIKFFLLILFEFGLRLLINTF